MRQLLAGAIALACALVSSVAGAEEFGRRPVALIVPYSAGGITDEVTRIVASKVSKNTGWSVIVENRPGGAGQIAANAVKQAAADGHTLLVGDIGTHAINASLYSKLSYDPVKDFAPVTEMVQMPHVLVVPADSPFKTLKELIEGARRRPGELVFGSVGVGSGAHLLGEMLKAEKKINIVHAPYRGSSQIVPDLMAGRIAMFFGAVGSMAPFIKDGKLRGLVVTDTGRSPLLPKVPSAPEANAPGLDLKVWFGILAPSATPVKVIDRLNAEFVKALNQADVRQHLGALGADVVANSPAQFAKVMAADTVRLGRVVKAAGVKVR
jgi:tripartite-type tricarboxylate transporter receptor subunit TctC